MEHWLPLFEERLATAFDHLGDDDLIVREVGTTAAAAARFEAIADYYQNRTKAMSAEPGSYRPLPPELLYLDKLGWNALAAERDRKSVVSGKSVSGRVDLGVRRIIKNKKLCKSVTNDITLEA